MGIGKGQDLHGIQVLRGLAAIAVLLFHVGEPFGWQFRVGAAGVDVFFVISGFIMWTTTAGRESTPLSFLRRRLARIVPLYWLATLATFVAVTLKPLWFYNHDASPVNYLRSLAFLPFVRDGQLHPVVLQGWTLSFELLFYLMVAAALPIRDERVRLAVLAAALAALVAARPLVPDGALAALMSPLLLEFLAGVVIAALWRRGVFWSTTQAILLIAAVIVWFVFDDLRPVDIDRSLTWGIPASLLVSSVLALETRGRLPHSRMLHAFGDASYSIYIWQVLFGALALAVLARLHVGGPALPLGVAALSFAMTLVAYGLVEKPLNRMLLRGSAKRRPVAKTAAP